MQIPHFCAARWLCVQVLTNQCLMDTVRFAEGYYIKAFKLPVHSLAR